MTEFTDLYHDLVLDHGRRPRNFRRMDHETAHADGYNPLCGDRINLQLRIQGDVVTDAAFQGDGCAISTASASLMTEALKGKTREQAVELFEKFHGLITGAVGAPTDMGKLAAFSGVRDYPVRVKCAALPWHTMRAALQGSHESVSTE